MGLVSLLLMPLGAEKLALAPMGWGIGVVAWLAHLVAGLPVARVSVPAMGGGGLVLFFAGLCWLCLWAGRARLLGALPVVLAVLSPWVGRMPVVLVAPDARMVGVVAGAGTDRAGHASRSLRTAGMAAGDRPARGPAARGGPAGQGGVPERDMPCCGAGGDIVLLLAARMPDAALCLGARVVVNLHGQAGCPGVGRVGRFDLWREGAYALYFRGGDGLEMRTDRATRGARPWVMRPGGAGMPDLPLAQAE
ncbi:ComEC/Rec2 family competence protein [Komagataeibacter rhaeticus]|nr:ComEC/Rec2 family competence protein [Komagataeibacter rhaeticus]